MSGSSDKSSSSKSLLSVQNIVIAGALWAILAFLFFLLFSTPGTPGEERTWYEYGTTIFELAAYLFAAVLCFRNWRSPQIVSGRNVWLAIGLAMLCYFFGGVLFFYWETVLGISPAVSPGDFFYTLTYLLLGYGLISAVFSRRLNLELWQWAVVAGIAAVGIGLATWVSTTGGAVSNSFLSDVAVAQTAPAKPGQAPARRSPAPTKAPAIRQSPAARPTGNRPPAKPPAARPPATPAAKPTKSPAAVSPSPTTEPSPAAPEKEAPAWAKDLEQALAPLEAPIQLFYVVSDVVLLIMASILLLAYWGGRSSLSWRMIAAAAFSLFIADIYFKYATAPIREDSYQSGGLLEVFWIFSGVLFGIGAALEHDLSTRSRRTTSRRRGS